MLTHFVFTASLPREKKKKNKRPLSRLTRNIGGQILSYEASSLPPEQASCHCQGISSHNSARPSDSVTRAAHCFHFFEIPLTNLLYDSVTKKLPALNGLFVQKATPGVKKNNNKKQHTTMTLMRCGPHGRDGSNCLKNSLSCGKIKRSISIQNWKDVCEALQSQLRII